MDVTWHIESLSCYSELDNLSDVVCSAKWRVDGVLVQNGVTYNASIGSTKMVKPYQEGDVFTPYEDLTEAQVIGWVQQALGANMVEAINENLLIQINNQISPGKVTPPLPWAS